jgi:hypothetical protein
MISAAMARGIVARDAWDRRARRAVVPNGGGDEDEDDEDGREVNRRATSERAAVRHCPPEIFIIFREGERETRAYAASSWIQIRSARKRDTKKMTVEPRRKVRSRDGRDERMDE